MSWKPEVIADSSGKWCGNALRFATKEEAEANVYDLSMRWMLVRDTRVVESDDPVNYAWIDGKLEPVTEWSGSPDPKDPDNAWVDDVTGERVDANTGERNHS